MHELTVVEGLMGILTSHAKANAIARITSVHVVIGRLRGLDRRQIAGCFEILAEGTLAEGARLDIEEIGIEGRCRDCGQTFAVPGFQIQCPTCSSVAVDLLSGQELHIKTFEGKTLEDLGVEESAASTT
ncbi:hydrogenase maturation nickel metallochaperone HypA [Rhodospirillum rubrum]|uniref:Hydrogenase maturation factor HypA n=1 Tax=Rhodospirillum rubrum (strain ATCC 11170 / ATH 1.1.1 / DSM 467 / LMG 4362 / NCIMB 8255 / S1) TaxID=269796 RepID=Q2RVW6_RHORT|nr:hydrogenase maturation nickel metallochaperone HypA [Rhodospirillum rubrum]ABC21729.1 Hydrogenase expression/synthesis, HypA [Rhodospirillum rubrum ATCC 11170]AEO47427.1 hydrogenase expression/synthesis, HypA [Rhodospirillum rubrum F11]MBK5953282.1 hydrogenase maturation nickel metallochaperone HypA [Rhodospirillum rubrum]QXG81391.1 hydrogenase maturation nickel metallochaperone HypA [Rhodospirillum rubrum]HCF17912.1 hydrogenase maturation nickel metallochaperone HypA [Rhodospirillum rubrum